jgi:VWFA-related protein
MRFAAALLAACAFSAVLAQPQFKTTVPLVVAPTTVTDSRGHYVDGLEERDLLLSDNNVRQAIHLDYEIYPISLVVAIENGAEAQPVLDKLGGSGILLSQTVAGGAGETAVISFSDEVRDVQDFTADPDLITRALKRMRVRSGGACSLDALMHALALLDRRPANQRHIVLLVAESRARGGQAALPDVVKEVQRQNALVYWLSYSTTLTSYTSRPKTVGDRKQEEEKVDRLGQVKTPSKDSKPLPADTKPMDLLAPFFALAHFTSPNLADLFSRTTGARTVGFLKKNGLEQAIQQIGEEVHRQYIISYQPPAAEPGEFRSIHVAVRGRPDLHAKTRAGYWAVR